MYIYKHNRDSTNLLWLPKGGTALDVWLLGSNVVSENGVSMLESCYNIIIFMYSQNKIVKTRIHKIIYFMLKKDDIL